MFKTISNLLGRKTNRRIKVSLHQLIDHLLAGLQPLALKHNSTIHNGVPLGLCFIAEEKRLAHDLWNLISTAVLAKNNVNIQVQTLVDDNHTLICLSHATNQNIVLRLCNSQMAH